MNTQVVRSYRWLFALVALFGLAADQASKYVVFTWLYADGPRPVEPWFGSFEIRTSVYPDHETGAFEASRRVELLDGTFSLTAVHFLDETASPDDLRYALQTVSGPNLPRVNTGALFGQKLGLAPADSNRLFAGVSFLAALAIVCWSGRPAVRRERLLSVALGLILAGTVGNCYDRLVFGGVRDFLHWYRFIDWPVFNVADCCLVCGAGLLIVHAFLYAEEETVAPAQAQSAEAAQAATSAPPAP